MTARWMSVPSPSCWCIGGKAPDGEAARSMVLHELDVETVSAAVSVDLTDEDTLTLNELDITSVSGTVNVNAANAGRSPFPPPAALSPAASAPKIWRRTVSAAAWS